MRFKKFTTLAVIMLFLFSMVTISDLTTDTVSGTNVSGIINKDTKWKLAKSPYIVKGNITLIPGKTLLIEPGVVVKFDGNYSIEIYGTLIAKGDYWGGKNITFTSSKSSPKVSDWYSLSIFSGALEKKSEISNCTISYAETGLHFKRTWKHVVDRCVINNVNRGIQFQRVRQITVQNCNINAKKEGFVSKLSLTSWLTNSNITGKDVGIYFEETERSRIVKNNVSGCKYGIYLLKSKEDNVRFNDIYKNKVGLMVINSNNNRIHRNNIMYNTKQLTNTSSTNLWVAKEFNLGNFWSDYTGKDDGSGGRFAGDGVGDTDLPHQGVDWYPLMKHGGWTNRAPVVELFSPVGGETWRGVQAILWNATDFDNDTLAVRLFYSPNNGTNWSIIQDNLTDTGEYTWDTTNLTDGTDYLVKIIVSDGSLEAENQSAMVFTIDNTPPEAVIFFNNITRRIEVIGVDNIDPDVEVTWRNLTKANKDKKSKCWWKKICKKIINKFFGKWVNRSYLLTDDAGNSLNLTVYVKDNYGVWYKHAKLRIVNITYNNEFNKTNTTIPFNIYDVSFYESKTTGNITMLSQHIRVQKHFEIYTSYSSKTWWAKCLKKSNMTQIFIRNETKGNWKRQLFNTKKLLLSGLWIVELVTNKGKIEYQY